jgi:hypothetical protein
VYKNRFAPVPERAQALLLELNNTEKAVRRAGCVRRRKEPLRHPQP